ncbi:MAG: NADPH:quinone oxidoreductase family protein [Bacteroidia bacterium]|nr:NADPH:quinone oxidoreductase family protein [Bacteroidia bacterium]
MRAIVCKTYGPPSSLVLEDLPSPVPKKGEVLVSVKACSINFPDTLIIQGLYQFKPPLPFSPGSDISGVVKSVGEGVKHVKEGDEVFGIVPYGGFAEEVIVPKAACFPKPVSMDFKTAAAFMMAYGTSFYALKNRAKLEKGDSLVVLGASGGVGLAAVELGKLMGARVIACASTSEKLELCKQFGADDVINYEEEDLKKRIKELTDGKGADIIYDPVGGKYSEPALRACGWEGRYLVVGFAAGDIPSIPLNIPLLKGCQVMGVFWGNFALSNPQQSMMNTMQLIQWYGEGMLKPHIHKTLPLEKAPAALEEIMARQVKGKIVLSME